LRVSVFRACRDYRRCMTRRRTGSGVFWLGFDLLCCYPGNSVRVGRRRPLSVELSTFTLADFCFEMFDFMRLATPHCRDPISKSQIGKMVWKFTRCSGACSISLLKIVIPRIMRCIPGSVTWWLVYRSMVPLFIMHLKVPDKWNFSDRLV